jgi:hypothetical protein
MCGVLYVYACMKIRVYTAAPVCDTRICIHARTYMCGVYVFIRVNENTRYTQRGPRPRQSAHIHVCVYICMRTCMCGVCVYTKRTSLPRQLTLASSLPLTFMHSSSAIDSSSLWMFECMFVFVCVCVCVSYIDSSLYMCMCVCV